MRRLRGSYRTRHFGLKNLRILWIFIIFLSCKKGFLESHWATSVSFQGEPPSRYSELEKSLDPENCGVCHKEQYEKWSSSLHSKSSGPGLQWQLKRIGSEESSSCFACHSPLIETQNFIRESKFKTANNPNEVLSYLKKETAERGISCASCHVRNQVRYGPPPREEKQNDSSSGHKAHGGFVVQKEFESSKFCISCHETPEYGKPVNGKRMMETYKEWEQSRYAKEQITCQNCHMPDRSHSWKGIHDPEMTANAVTSTLGFKSIGGESYVYASLKNTGVGHKFPTYSVPKIFLFLSVYENGKQKRILTEKTIGRVTDLDLKHEFEDTRLLPDEEIVLKERLTLSDLKTPKEIRFTAVVEPDEFYVRMFQHNWVRRNEFGITGAEEKQLEEALKNAKSTRYVLFEKRIQTSSLTDGFFSSDRGLSK
ncbi:cytochrome c554 and C-prime [Leptospira barantonii]|uniref:Cytochrome c554 and C-prime n=1 Tax=Leptospira barantonii TaxID=2023184 RepID=A0A5F2B0L5_9LEPT|nr:cytochrome c554 and C-prime [Leptospira barantonii]